MHWAIRTDKRTGWAIPAGPEWAAIALAAILNTYSARGMWDTADRPGGY